MRIPNGKIFPDFQTGIGPVQRVQMHPGRAAVKQIPNLCLGKPKPQTTHPTVAVDLLNVFQIAHVPLRNGSSAKTEHALQGRQIPHRQYPWNDGDGHSRRPGLIHKAEIGIVIEEKLSDDEIRPAC